MAVAGAFSARSARGITVRWVEWGECGALLGSAPLVPGYACCGRRTHRGTSRGSENRSSERWNRQRIRIEPSKRGVNGAFAVGASGVQTPVFVCGTHPTPDRFPGSRKQRASQGYSIHNGSKAWNSPCFACSSWIISNAMNAIAFETLKFANRLKEAGFTEQQAEALADAEAEFIEQNLATKRAIADIKRDIKGLEVTLRN
ncbi:MAG: hypothetical protein M3461_23840 [Pseudomonadota bacterium]|nr:hypothetical protein [Pseudomonadota bacterium]